MKTVVSAYGPFVMNVFDPLSTNVSPSRTAVERMPPNASDPLSGSVIAHAPTCSSVSSGSAHRSRCSGVPFFTALPARFIETPIAVIRPGQCRQNSTIGNSVITARSYRSSVVNDGPDVSRAKRSLAISSIPNVRT